MNDLIDGMSLRDYFAAAAITGIEAAEREDYGYGGEHENAARRAYARADAMLRVRDE